MPMDVNTSKLETEFVELHEDERETIIKVDDVSMVFNMASEKLNNLKEYFIAIAKHELKFKELRALDRISFEVKRGDVFGIMGTNGSGKSTILKIIAGVLDPTTGKCTVNGTIAPLIELGAGFDMELTARENIFMNGALLGYSDKTIRDHFDEIVDFAEIKEFLDMPMKNYSSGMVARVAFAVATVIVPDILIVDEVLSVGDFMFQKKCEDRIQTLIDKYGVTVLIVSHSNEQIARLCNKAIWIEKGHVRLSGSANRVCTIYGGLGGRTGDVESESFVFDLLNRVPEDKGSLRYDSISGNSPADFSANLANKGWGAKGPCSDVILSPITTHINGVLAAPLAGKLDAPILLPGKDELTPPVERFLFNKKPERIYIIDCGSAAKPLLDALGELPWNPEIIDLSGTGNVLEYSVWLLEQFNDLGIEFDKVAIVEFDDYAESILLSPLLSHELIPVIFVRESSGEASSEVIMEAIASFGIESVISSKETLRKLSPADIIRGKCDVDPIPNCCSRKHYLGVSQWEKSMLNDFRNACLASDANGQFSYLAACGPYASKNKQIIVLIDLVDLESIKDVTRYISEKDMLSMSFVGSNSAFSELEKDMFAVALQ